MSIDELRELEQAATPGRWYHLIDDYGEPDPDGRPGSMFLTHEAVLNDRQTPLALGVSWADAALIAAARNALPALLDVAEAARPLVLWLNDPTPHTRQEAFETLNRRLIALSYALARLEPDRR